MLPDSVASPVPGASCASGAPGMSAHRGHVLEKAISTATVKDAIDPVVDDAHGTAGNHRSAQPVVRVRPVAEVDDVVDLQLWTARALPSPPTIFLPSTSGKHRPMPSSRASAAARLAPVRPERLPPRHRKHPCPSRGRRRANGLPCLSPDMVNCQTRLQQAGNPADRQVGYRAREVGGNQSMTL